MEWSRRNAVIPERSASVVWDWRYARGNGLTVKCLRNVNEFVEIDEENILTYVVRAGVDVATRGLELGCFGECLRIDKSELSCLEPSLTGYETGVSRGKALQGNRENSRKQESNAKEKHWNQLMVVLRENAENVEISGCAGKILEVVFGEQPRR